VGTRTEVSWVTEESRREVTTQAVVVWRPRDKRVAVYAFGGWHAWRAVLRARAAVRWYRARFGIETGYRQLNEVRGGTTATSLAYRLLLVGVALLLRQAWVWLSGVLARDRWEEAGAWVGDLTLRCLAEWLADEVKARYPEGKEIELRRPISLPPELLL
jgi:hypothetical protein